jgi:hypothetical protein
MLALATAEFKAETYDINKVARTVIVEMEQQVCVPGEEAAMSTYSRQVIQFCASVGGVPRYYIELLNE